MMINFELFINLGLLIQGLFYPIPKNQIIKDSSLKLLYAFLSFNTELTFYFRSFLFS